MNNLAKINENNNNVTTPFEDLLKQISVQTRLTNKGLLIRIPHNQYIEQLHFFYDVRIGHRKMQDYLYHNHCKTLIQLYPYLINQAIKKIIKDTFFVSDQVLDEDQERPKWVNSYTTHTLTNMMSQEYWNKHGIEQIKTKNKALKHKLMFAIKPHTIGMLMILNQQKFNKYFSKTFKNNLKIEVANSIVELVESFKFCPMTYNELTNQESFKNLEKNDVIPF